MQDYFSSEGLAYKFIPVKTPGNNPNSFGKVNIDKMYHNIMKVYKWGNMETKGVNVDYYVRRTMTNNYRLMFYTLAQELSNDGRTSEAKEKNSLQNIKMIEDTLAKGFGNRAVLTEQLTKFKATVKRESANKIKRFAMCDTIISKCFHVMPEFNVPYDRIIPSFVPILYQIGKKEKAREIIDIMIKQEYDNFVYYRSMEPRFCASVLESAQVSFRIIGMLEQIARESKDIEKADMIKAKEEIIAGKLTSWVQRCLNENQEYRRKAQFDETLAKAQKMFPPKEADVYRQGDKILIRLKSGNFVSGRSEVGAAALVGIGSC